MSTCNLIKITCDLIYGTYYHINHIGMKILQVNMIMLLVDINMLHVELDKSHFYIIMIHVGIIYLACRGAEVCHKMFVIVICDFLQGLNLSLDFRNVIYYTIALYVNKSFSIKFTK